MNGEPVVVMASVGSAECHCDMTVQNGQHEWQAK